MKFGLFGGAQAVPGDVVTEAALGYHEYGEYIQLAEKLRLFECLAGGTSFHRLFTAVGDS